MNLVSSCKCGNGSQASEGRVRGHGGAGEGPALHQKAPGAFCSELGQTGIQGEGVAISQHPLARTFHAGPSNPHPNLEKEGLLSHFPEGKTRSRVYSVSCREAELGATSMCSWPIQSLLCHIMLSLAVLPDRCTHLGGAGWARSGSPTCLADHV